MGIFKSTSVTFPGYSYIEVDGINSSGQMVVFAQQNLILKALTGTADKLSLISVPNEISVIPRGITESGTVYGWASAGIGGDGTGVGFVDSGGTITTVSYRRRMSARSRYPVRTCPIR